MSFVAVDSALWNVVADIVSDEGLSLYDIELVSARSLRVYVERVGAPEQTAKGQGGVTSDDCTRICRRLMVFFAAEGAALNIAAEPEIEVSSPGVNRHLRLESHYRSALGSRVKVSGSLMNGNGQSHGMSVVGNLREISPEVVIVTEENSGKEHCFRLTDITKARIDFKF